MTAIDLVFKALADPSRRALIDRLHAGQGLTLTALCADLDLTRQAVSQHLAVLESANLIAVEWRGREKLHYFNPVPIHAVYERWIRKFEQPRLAALHDLKTALERSTDDQETTHADPEGERQAAGAKRRAVRVRDLHRRHA